MTASELEPETLAWLSRNNRGTASNVLLNTATAMRDFDALAKEKKASEAFLARLACPECEGRRYDTTTEMPEGITLEERLAWVRDTRCPACRGEGNALAAFRNAGAKEDEKHG